MPNESLTLEPRLTRALDELRTLIRTHYPEAQFAVRRDVDDPATIQLMATVAIEEPDDVLDVVIDRLLALQVEERVPIHVIPLRPLARLVTRAGASLPNPHMVLANFPHA